MFVCVCIVLHMKFNEKLTSLKYFFLNANRKRKEWDVYEPIVDLLSNEEVDALEAKEERNFR